MKLPLKIEMFAVDGPDAGSVNQVVDSEGVAIWDQFGSYDNGTMREADAKQLAEYANMVHKIREVFASLTSSESPEGLCGKLDEIALLVKPKLVE